MSFLFSSLEMIQRFQTVNTVEILRPPQTGQLVHSTFLKLTKRGKNLSEYFLHRCLSVKKLDTPVQNYFKLNHSLSLNFIRQLTKFQAGNNDRLNLIMTEIQALLIRVLREAFQRI